MLTITILGFASGPLVMSVDVDFASDLGERDAFSPEFSDFERSLMGLGSPMPLSSVRARIDAWRVKNPK